ncbi:MAG: LptF/LptG family permease [Cyclobacteriaceae bacterium]|nr:LptF/LptG family permease [Cyclobacteriaceae bacterium]
MKKIDKLIIKAFIGPFILTFAIIVFILLTVQMMNYVDQIFGKDLSYVDLGVLVMHFAIFQTPIAFPLAVMLASLMTFGNLGEHFELTAIKSAGISLIRAMVPIFVLVIFVTIIAFFSNNYLVPNSALKAYSLLYDIRQKKPALDIEPGLFYGGIDKYKIKVDSKLPDGKTLLGVIIYNHTDRNGNKEVTIADSGMMYTIMNDQYLKFELFNGSNYLEGKGKSTRGRIQNYQHIGPFTRTYFKKSEIIFDLSSFGMSRTDEGLFASNRLMRNFNELNRDLDSLSTDIILSKAQVFDIPKRFFTYSNLKEAIVIPPEIAEVQLKEDSIKRERLKKQNEKNKVRLEEDLEREKGIDSVKVKKTKPKEIQKNKIAGPQKKANKKNLTKIDTSKVKPPKRFKRPPNFNKQNMVVPIASNKQKADRIKQTEDDKKEIEDVRKKANLKKAKKKPIKKLSNQEVVKAIHKKYEDKNQRLRTLKAALATTRQAKSKLSVQNSRIEQLQKSYFEFDIQWHKMLAAAAACLSMFLIGAPLGAIIKKGGLGFPVLVSILFFIIYYVISIGGEKYAKSGILPVFQGVWAANILLFPIGVFFLRQAKNDARLFEVDYYLVVINNLVKKIKLKIEAKG